MLIKVKKVSESVVVTENEIAANTEKIVTNKNMWYTYLIC